MYGNLIGKTLRLEPGLIERAARSSKAEMRRVDSGAAKPRLPSTPITRPAQIDHSVLQQFGRRAVWVAKLEEAVELLDDLAHDLSVDVDNDADTLQPDVELQDEEPLDTARSVVGVKYEEVDRELENDVIAWLAEDPEHWPIFRLILLDSWQDGFGRWRDGVPTWIRALGTNVVISHYQQDPFGRKGMVDL